MRSQSIASSQPPPRQNPDTAATIGVRTSDRVPAVEAPVLVQRDRRRRRQLADVGARRERALVAAEHDGADLRDRRRARQGSDDASISSPESAFSCFGRFMSTMPTRPSRSTRTLGSSTCTTSLRASRSTGPRVDPAHHAAQPREAQRGRPRGARAPGRDLADDRSRSRHPRRHRPRSGRRIQLGRRPRPRRGHRARLGDAAPRVPRGARPRLQHRQLQQADRRGDSGALSFP